MKFTDSDLTDSETLPLTRNQISLSIKLCPLKSDYEVWLTVRYYVTIAKRMELYSIEKSKSVVLDDVILRDAI